MTLNILIACATLLALAWIASHALAGRDAAIAQAARELAMHARLEIEPARELAAAVEALAAAAAAIHAATAERGPSRLGHRVTVHTKQPDDQTIFGVVAGEYSDRIVLEDAEYVTKTGGKPLPGRQDIDRADIAWIDVHAHVSVPDLEAQPST